MSNDKLAEIIRSLGYTTQRQTAEIVAAIRDHEAEKQAGPVAVQAAAPVDEGLEALRKMLQAAVDQLTAAPSAPPSESDKAEKQAGPVAVVNDETANNAAGLADMLAGIADEHSLELTAAARWALDKAAGMLRAYPPSESDKEDAESALKWLYEEGCDLRSEARSEDDYGYVVVEHYMAKPHERVIGRGDKPLDAIRAARAKKEQQ